MSISVYVCSQTSSSLNKKEDEHELILSISNGVTHHFGTNFKAGNRSTFTFLEYSAGYLINKHNEIGLKIGRNDFASVTTYNPKIWYAFYYKFNYKTWFSSLTIGTFIGFIDAYTSLSIGKDFNITNMFYINAAASYSRASERLFDFKKCDKEQLTISAGLAIKF